MKINMRNSEDKSSGSLAPSIGQQSTSGVTNGNPKIRIAVFGQHEVGKSALTVRYLTRRYIGEYKSSTDLLYHQTVKIGHSSIDVEIVDISTSAGPTASRRKSFPIEEIQRADAFVIVYSIIDHSSFTFAQEALETISNYCNQSTSPALAPLSTSTSPGASPQPKHTCPILLIANKNDLEHLRMVEKVEGLTISMQYRCHFYELSVAENSPEVYTSFQNLISSFITQHKEPTKRKLSVSKMLSNLRLGRSSPSHQVVTSQASVVDTDILSSSSDSMDNIPSTNPSTPIRSHHNHHHLRQSSIPETGSTSSNGSSTTSNSISNGLGTLKSKLVELHSIKRRNHSPPICSL